MKIGVFGGSFDPVHYGHLLLAESCREQLALDKVFFVPAGQPPHKQTRRLTPAPHRVAMLELALGGEAGFDLCLFEARRSEISYTVDTLRWFHEQFPGGEFFLLLGADMLNDLPNWREAAEVCRLALPIGVHRGGSEPPQAERLATVMTPERYRDMLARQVEMPQVAFSASEIRLRVAEGKSIRFRLPKAVEAYIFTHGLYKESESEPATRAAHSGTC